MNKTLKKINKSDILQIISKLNKKDLISIIEKKYFMSGGKVENINNLIIGKVYYQKIDGSISKLIFINFSIIDTKKYCIFYNITYEKYEPIEICDPNRWLESLQETEEKFFNRMIKNRGIIKRRMELNEKTEFFDSYQEMESYNNSYNNNFENRVMRVSSPYIYTPKEKTPKNSKVSRVRFNEKISKRTTFLNENLLNLKKGNSVILKNSNIKEYILNKNCKENNLNALLHEKNNPNRKITVSKNRLMKETCVNEVNSIILSNNSNSNNSNRSIK